LEDGFLPVGTCICIKIQEFKHLYNTVNTDIISKVGMHEILGVNNNQKSYITIKGKIMPVLN
jgi:hypothetical protein